MKGTKCGGGGTEKSKVVTDGEIKAYANGTTKEDESSNLNSTMFSNCLPEHISQETNNDSSQREKNDPHDSHNQSMNQDNLSHQKKIQIKGIQFDVERNQPLQ